VAVVRAQPLAVVREPRADMLVLGGGEDNIAISVVSAGGLVTAQQRGEGQYTLDLGQSPLLEGSSVGGEQEKGRNNSHVLAAR
jgi:hypothetical protein